MRHRVLLHGATGETGSEILDGLLADGSFDIAALVRPQSFRKPATKSLELRRVQIIVSDLEKQPMEKIAELLAGFDTVISAVATNAQLDQLKLVDAAAKAGITRFVPCGFTSISPPGGVMSLIRNDKEKIHERIWYHHLPYTIIDTGTWFQISFPRLSSGKADYAYLGDANTLVADGNARSLMIDKRDIGKLTAMVIKDDRTLNKRVFFNVDSSSQNEIQALMENKSGEKIVTNRASHDELWAKMYNARAIAADNPSNHLLRFAAIAAEYSVCKYVRQDNTPENARYLGYLDSKVLYPDLVLRTFSTFLDELLAGNAKQLYREKLQFMKK